MVGAEGTKLFDFDNPRVLEKALSGKELHQNYFYLLKSTKSTKTTSQKCWFLKNVEEILFGRIFLGTQTVQTVSKRVWVRRWYS